MVPNKTIEPEMLFVFLIIFHIFFPAQRDDFRFFWYCDIFPLNWCNELQSFVLFFDMSNDFFSHQVSNKAKLRQIIFSY